MCAVVGGEVGVVVAGAEVAGCTVVGASVGGEVGVVVVGAEVTGCTVVDASVVGGEVERWWLALKWLDVHWWVPLS
ncbi:hypothetical protein CYMTET_29534 [Cymbomonas tetramitiformis]|uniref:Uncharacterized protein n=1 Tax=Cymbomonas tetramitiformis TaxID=36881 RepID=A0AAE0KUT7_9CHLO|nr:hypothetical protein CYMTET_29534 [Cymbomonas tetramitiformis]